MPDWVVRLIVTALLVWGVIPNPELYVRHAAPADPGAVLEHRIEEAAGGMVVLSSVSPDDHSAWIIYADTPEDWGIELGLVMQGIAHAVTWDGVELGGVMLDYGISPTIGNETGIVTVTGDRIVRFIYGRTTQRTFNYEMLHTQHNGLAPDIVRP